MNTEIETILSKQQGLSLVDEQAASAPFLPGIADPALLQLASIGAESLVTPLHAPCPFVITPVAGFNSTAPLQFAVRGASAVDGTIREMVYRMEGREHAHYLDLFGQLAADFGLRVPKNRQALAVPSFRATFTEVLLEHKDAGMRYGYGDPAVLKVEHGPGSGYYLVATSNDAPQSFPVLFSPDLKEWTFLSYAFPQGAKPGWVLDGEGISDFWAPELHAVGNEFRLYFVARHKDTRELCIGMAQADKPEGPFRAEESPILAHNVIDPHLYVAADRKAYLYWKEDNNDVWPGLLLELFYEHTGLLSELFTNGEDRATASFALALWPWIKTLEPIEKFLLLQVFIESIVADYTAYYRKLGTWAETLPQAIQQRIRNILTYMKTPMYAQQLTEDGSCLVGERTKVIENDLPWEAHLVEGMWVTEQQGRFYLFYAGNDFSTDDYGIGVAVADHPAGPYTKMPKPFLRSTAEWSAPGHPSVAPGLDGTPTLFLHAYFPGQAGYKQFRALLSVPLQFGAEGVTMPPTALD